MAADRITELRLTSFKSYRDVALSLAPLTVLIGRNGGGKSNALDALEVLSRLARGGEIRDALDGARRDAGPVRGGIEGCPPIGSDIFELGVSIARAAGEVRLDVEIQVRPQVQILRDTLTADVDGRRRVLLETTAPNPHRADIEAKVWNNKRGRDPHYQFRATHLLTAQLPLRLGGPTVAERHVLEAAEVALAVLGGVFHQDPVPQLMRQYVPEQDVVLRRNGENLSATIARLRRDDQARFAELVEVIKDLPEHESERGAEGAELVVEIRSAGDETYEKIDFYAELGVREMLIAHPEDRRVELLRFVDGRSTVVSADAEGWVRSDVLGARFGTADKQLHVSWEDGFADI